MSGAESPIATQMAKEFAHRILHARLALPGGGVDADAIGVLGQALGHGDRPVRHALDRQR